MKATRYAGADLTFELLNSAAVMVNLRTFSCGVQVQLSDASRNSLSLIGRAEEVARMLEQIAAEVRALAEPKP